MMKFSIEVVFNPKAQCELGGRGIEYLWGVLKILFRRENTCLDNNKRVNSLKPRIKRIITNIPAETYQKCSRCAQEYKLSYATLLSDDDIRRVDLKIQDTEKIKMRLRICVVQRIRTDDNNCKKTSNITKFEFKHQKFETWNSKSIVCKNTHLFVNTHLFSLT